MFGRRFHRTRRSLGTISTLEAVFYVMDSARDVTYQVGDLVVYGSRNSIIVACHEAHMYPVENACFIAGNLTDHYGTQYDVEVSVCGRIFQSVVPFVVGGWSFVPQPWRNVHRRFRQLNSFEGWCYSQDRDEEVTSWKITLSLR